MEASMMAGGGGGGEGGTGHASPYWGISLTATYLGMSDDWVYRHAEEIGGVQFGSKWRFDPEIVKGYYDRAKAKLHEKRGKRRRKRSANE